jgi:hypothetical protein
MVDKKAGTLPVVLPIVIYQESGDSQETGVTGKKF